MDKSSFSGVPSSSQSLSAVQPASTARNTIQVPLPVLSLPAGTLLTGTVIGKDARGNTSLKTDKGDILIKSNITLNTGNEVVLRIDSAGKSFTAKIISVDGHHVSPTALLVTPEGEAKPEATRPAPSQAPSQSSAPADKVNVPETTRVPLSATLVKPSTLLPDVIGSLPPALRPSTPLSAGSTIALELINIIAPSAKPTRTAATPPPLRANVVPPASANAQYQAYARSSQLGATTPPVPPATPPLNQAGAPLPIPTSPSSSPLSTTPPQTPNTPAANSAPPPAAMPPQAATAPAPVVPAVVTKDGTPHIPAAPPSIPATNNAPPTPATPTTNTPANIPPTAPSPPTSTLTTSVPAPTTPTTAPLTPPVPSGATAIPVAEEPAVPPPLIGQTLAKGEILGRVLQPDAGNKESLVHTPLGLVRLETPVPLPAGTKLALQIVSLSPQPTTATSTPPAATPDGAPAPELARHWPGLSELIHWLGVRDPSLATNLADRIPTPGPQLASDILFFITALRGGDVRTWLSHDVTRLLEQENRRDLITRITGEFQTIRGAFVDTANQPWQMLAFPVVYQGDLRQARMFLKKEREKEDPVKKDTSRFIVEVELSALGAMQFDGFLHKAETTKKPAFDLVIRTLRALPEPVAQDIRTIFSDSAALTGLSGSVQFRVSKEFPIRPMEEIFPPPGEHSGILA